MQPLRRMRHDAGILQVRKNNDEKQGSECTFPCLLSLRIKRMAWTTPSVDIQRWTRADQRRTNDDREDDSLGSEAAPVIHSGLSISTGCKQPA